MPIVPLTSVYETCCWKIKSCLWWQAGVSRQESSVFHASHLTATFPLNASTSILRNSIRLAADWRCALKEITQGSVLPRGPEVGAETLGTSMFVGSIMNPPTKLPVWTTTTRIPNAVVTRGLVSSGISRGTGTSGGIGRSGSPDGQTRCLNSAVRGHRFSRQILRALTFVSATHSIFCSPAAVTRSCSAAIYEHSIGGSNAH
jgi:hypothetical protein